MNTVTIRNLHIGQGTPAVIVPIAEESREGILAMGEKLRQTDADAVEWRADFYDGIGDAQAALILLGELRLLLGDIPLIFTCRTQKEGGRAHMADEEYAAFNRAIIDSGYADAIDIEVFSYGEHVAELISDIRKAGQVSIGSCHLMKMPNRDHLEGMLKAIHDTGADITKLAAMADCPNDAITLMAAARRAKEQGIGPLIAIAIGEQGMISRVLAEMAGSDAVFATVGKGSAPGQLSLGAMREILKTVHENIR